MTIDPGVLDNYLEFLEAIISKGGPDKADYDALDAWFKEVFQNWKKGVLSNEHIDNIRKKLGPALSKQTTQGFSYVKPYGYAGDFEMIDKIYQRLISKNPDLRKWDEYGHASDGPVAVRNRKSYFISLLRRLSEKYPHQAEINVLNVGSGPGRDLLEYYSSDFADSRLFVTCIDHDGRAIEYSKSLCEAFMSNIDFHDENIFRYKPPSKYDLVWSAGLFDYLSDKQFVFLLKRLLTFINEPGGEMVIGNFSTNNNARPYMELLLDWELQHRSEEDLIALGIAAGTNEKNMHVGREPRGVNLFLHIDK